MDESELIDKVTHFFTDKPEFDYPIIKRLQEEKIRRFINEYRNNKQQNGISGEMSQQK